MGVFAVSTWIANQAQEFSNAPESSWYDLGWSTPFCLVALAATFWDGSQEEKSVLLRIPDISRVVFAYLPSLILPVLLLLNYHEVVREQVFLGLFGLMFSIVLFNARLALTLRRQRLTMEALHAKEHQYHSLFERNMAGVFRSTLDGKLVDCNPAFANMFGYAREDLQRLSLYGLYFGGAEERDEWIKQLRREGSPHPREFCLRRKDGSQLWVVQNANIEKHADGSELLEGTLVDITERKLTTLAIEEWKRRYDDAVLASAQIIYESDPESSRVTLGGCVREILGYSAEELSGDAQAWLALIHPEDKAHYLEKLRSAATTSGTIEFEYRARRKNNGYRTLWEQAASFALWDSSRTSRNAALLKPSSGRRRRWKRWGVWLEALRTISTICSPLSTDTAPCSSNARHPPIPCITKRNKSGLPPTVLLPSRNSCSLLAASRYCSRRESTSTTSCGMWRSCSAV
jgi:PAS domain S-box-containing protein